MAARTLESRRGFTLVELLVVITIIGILVSLLLPGVQAAREAARRTSCQNNFKQVGLALLQYHLSHERLPPATASKPKPHTWVLYVLPYMEQANLADAYRRGKKWTDKKNQKAVSTPVPTLLCASAPLVTSRMDHFGAGKVAAPSDYSPTTGVAGQLHKMGLMPKSKSYRGAMNSNKGIPLALVRDGTSQTILVTEDAGRPQHWTSQGRGPDNHDNGCGNLDVKNGRVKGGGWADSSISIPLHGFTRDGLACHGPCGMNCTNNNEAFSFHTGGINAVFCDGSVHFLTESMPVRVYAALITRKGGEIVSGSDY